MFKKIAILCLAVLLSIGLVACGKQNNDVVESNNLEISTTENETSNVSTSEETDTEETAKFSWNVKEMDSPVMPELTVEKKDFLNLIQVDIATTPFDFDVESIFSNLKNNSFLNENFGEFVRGNVENSYGEYYTDVKHQQNYYLTDSLAANLNTSEVKNLQDTSDFYLAFKKNTAEYSNIYKVELKFENLKITDTLQDELSTVVTPIFGEYAEYMLYAKDPDGQSYSKYASFDNFEKLGLSERISAGENSYYIIRNVKKSKQENCIDISFLIGVSYNPHRDDFGYYGADTTSMYESLDVHFEDLFSSDFGNNNPLNASTFGDKIFKTIHSGYDYSVIDEWDFQVYKTESGKVQKYLFLKCKGHVTTDSYFIWFPNLEFKITLTEENGVTKDLDINVTAQAYDPDGDVDKNALFELVKNFGKSMLSDINLDDFVYTEGVYFPEKEITSNLLGVPTKGTAKMTFFNNNYTFNANLTSKQ